MKRKILLFICTIFVLIQVISCNNSVPQPTAGVMNDTITVENLTINTLTLNGLEIVPSNALSIDVSYCSLKCTNCGLNEVLIAPCHIEVSGECGEHSIHRVSSDA